MSNDLTINQTADGYWGCYCNKCGRAVDCFHWERDVHIVRSFLGRERFVSAGTATITVECHGEKFVTTVSG